MPNTIARIPRRCFAQRDAKIRHLFLQRLCQIPGTARGMHKWPQDNTLQPAATASVGKTGTEMVAKHNRRTVARSDRPVPAAHAASKRGRRGNIRAGGDSVEPGTAAGQLAGPAESHYVLQSTSSPPKRAVAPTGSSHQVFRPVGRRWPPVVCPRQRCDDGPFVKSPQPPAW